jgi:hypothetical protein
MLAPLVLTVSATNPGKSLLVVSGEGGKGNSDSWEQGAYAGAAMTFAAGRRAKAALADPIERKFRRFIILLSTKTATLDMLLAL